MTAPGVLLLPTYLPCAVRSLLAAPRWMGNHIKEPPSRLDSLRRPLPCFCHFFYSSDLFFPFLSYTTTYSWNPVCSFSIASLTNSKKDNLTTPASTRRHHQPTRTASYPAAAQTPGPPLLPAQGAPSTPHAAITPPNRQKKKKISHHSNHA